MCCSSASQRQHCVDCKSHRTMLQEYNHWAWHPWLHHSCSAWIPLVASPPAHQNTGVRTRPSIAMVDAPGCLQDLVTRRVVRRTLRSSNIPQLTVPRTVAKSKTLVDLCFSVAAPPMYNHLSDGVREDLSFTSFERKLKTQLFIEYFGHYSYGTKSADL